MKDGQFTEYNGIKVGDTVKIITTNRYWGYGSWIDYYGFSRSGWWRSTSDRPALNSKATVVGIGKHLNYDYSLPGDDAHHVLFYVDCGDRKWILREEWVEPYPKTRNRCIKNEKQTIYFIIN